MVSVQSGSKEWHSTADSHAQTHAVANDRYEKELSNSPESIPDSPSMISSSLDHLASGRWITNPRARVCYGNVQLGLKMGGIVGGIFGALAGTLYAVQSRQFLLLPASVLICKSSLLYSC